MNNQLPPEFPSDADKAVWSGKPAPIGNLALIERVSLWLQYVEFAGYGFRVYEAYAGVVLQAMYMDADTYTGKPELQWTRKWPISPEMTESEVIQTAFKCVLTSMEHRAREGFKYHGARVFGPHFDVQDLVRLCQDGRENAGGRA